MTPQAVDGRTTIARAPSAAPNRLRSTFDNFASAAERRSIQLPKYPPTRTAAGSAVGPPACTNGPENDVPSAPTYTPGARTAPDNVSRIDPGSAAVPTLRNQAAP